MNLGAIPAREAARNGGKPALVDAATGRVVTYAELERRVAALARGFAAQPGVAYGSRIAILAYNGIEYVEVILAAARAGLVALGLNWRLAPEELARVVRDGEPAVLIVDDACAELGEALLRREDAGVVLAYGPGSDGSYEAFVAAGERAAPLTREPAPDDPVLIISTGGSTGEPKGAVHTHGSAIAGMVNNAIAERIRPDDRYLMLGQMFHSASVLAINYLMNGATLLLLPRFEPRPALEAIERERVTASLIFPAMINHLLAATGDGGFDLASLRNVQYGGGPLALRVILELLDTLPCTLIQCYGSSEHLAVTFLSQEDHLAARRAGDEHRLASCGREAFLTRVRLLGPDGAPVPWDGRTTGEIVVRSPANMRGYWRRPDLTRAATTPDGWLRTGDLARADADGYLFVVDRLGDMIISGGENIYALQVENAIAGHPAVREVAVVGVPDPQWGESVKAFVVLRAGRAASADDIRHAVTTRLGSYQKPRHVEFVRELPRTPAGKVARSHLRARSQRAGAAAPATPERA